MMTFVRADFGRGLLFALALCPWTHAGAVTLSGPTNGTYVAPVSITMTATTDGGDGDVTSLRLLAGSITVYIVRPTDTVPIPNPVNSFFNTQIAGTYVLQAKATDGFAGTTTQSNTFSVTVTGGLKISLTSPANNTSASAPAAFNLTASVQNDAYGYTYPVSFYVDGVLLSTDATAPYAATFSSLVLGTHVLTAKVTDINNQTLTSTAVNVTIVNTPPTVSLTAPTAGASATAPATFFLSANAADSNGTVTNVKFYADGQLLGTDSAAPYTWQYTTSTVGSHSITAVATDNNAASTTSSAVAVSVVNGVSVKRSYVYDASERLCKTINPESGATLVDYDAAGNIAWSVEGSNLTSATCDRASVPAGAKTTRTYDQMNRVTAVSTPGGSADLTTGYAPDGAVSSLTAANPGGYNVTTTYSYNKRRLLTGETASNGATLFTLGYAYNANAHLSALTYPDNQVVSYAPDALGRATQVTDSSGQTYASAISYFPNGAIAQFSYGNGIVHTLTQNTRRLPGRSRDANGATAVLDDSYAFDGNGNVTDITDQAQAGLTTRGMAYDGLDRLTAAVSPGQWGTATYGYDALDNLRSADQGARQYRYNYDASNRLSTIKTPAGATQFTFGYDARGNTTGKNAQAYGFDSANRLSAVTGQQSYRYDGQGRRVQTTDADSKTTFWLYSQSGQVLYTSEARRSQNLSYITLGNTQVATRVVAWGTGATAIRYQHTDALGSPVAETDPSRNVLKRNRYAPYGEAFAPTVIDGTGYTGHVMDQATGLTYMQQRYYDPQIGRFLSVDPAASEFNRYNYASNNPYRFTDPDGREACTGTRIAGPCGGSSAAVKSFGGSGDRKGEFGSTETIRGKEVVNIPVSGPSGSTVTEWRNDGAPTTTPVAGGAVKPIADAAKFFGRLTRLFDFELTETTQRQVEYTQFTVFETETVTEVTLSDTPYGSKVSGPYPIGDQRAVGTVWLPSTGIYRDVHVKYGGTFCLIDCGAMRELMK